MKFMLRSDFGTGNTQALDTILQLNKYIASENNVIFDFSQYNENNPFNNLIIANSIRNYIDKHPEINVSINPKKNDGYLKHIGFYDNYSL